MAAIAFAAKSVDLCAMVVPEIAVFCHEWPGDPTMKQAVPNSTVGVFHETSATSVDPPPPLRSSPNGS